MKLGKKINAVFGLDDENLPASDRFRLQAALIVATVHLFSQITGVIIVSIFSEGLVRAHLFNIAGVVIAALGFLYIRISRNYMGFAIYAFFIPLVMAVLGATLSKAGVFSNAMFLLPMSILFAGLISGWRMALGCAALATATVLGLTMYTEGLGLKVVVTGTDSSYQVMLWKRCFYIVSTCVATGLVTAYLSDYMHGLFHKMEESVDSAQRAERSKSRFLANMSHEIRTPLNGIIGMSGLLMRTEMTDQQKQYANIVNQSSQGLVSIVNDVLDISKLDAEVMQLRTAPFKLNDLMFSVVQLHSSNAQQKNIRLALHIPPKAPNAVVGDAGRIRQVLNNLVSNAVKFTEEGRIDVGVLYEETNDNQAKLTFFVKDTGIGLSEKNLERIFDRFEQVDNPVMQNTGTGLGLSISREFVELMGGNIRAESTPNEGSTFTFNLTLPVAKLSEDMEPDTNTLKPRSYDTKLAS